MANLKLSHIYKVYPNGAKAVNDFNMEIEDKEFIVFVGPSGCGKSTTLRMIAGLEDITAGELKIGDKVVNNVEPKDRDIAMVFQNYALYPHMTVYDNMAFGLKLRRLQKEEIDRKVKEAAEILGITEYLDRKPKEMSGGQRQRVALGRAIVREPKVFLLDEPLSNLDAKLRTTMRTEISKLHNKLKTTFIYVTHDQVEAMTMGTRIVVMKDGFVQQIDSPRNLYRYPANKFVAGFIGTPQMNFYDGKLKLNGGTVRVSVDSTPVVFDAPAELFNKTDRQYLDGEKPVILGIRAEFVSADPEKYPYKAKCRITAVEELGTERLIYADFDTGCDEQATESPTKIIIKTGEGAEYEYGQIIDISLDLTHMIAFDKQTENSIMPRIPENVVVDGEVKSGKLKMLGSEFKLPAALSLADGKYEITVPVSSVSLNGTVKASVFKEEKINGLRLLHLKVADRVLFALDPDCKAESVKGVSVDFKQLTFNCGSAVFDPVPSVNCIEGKLVKYKKIDEKEVNGKIKKVKSTAYNLQIGESSVSCPDGTAKALYNGCGRDIYKSRLDIRFSPYSIKIADEGIDAAVEKVLDYGNERFAVCRLGEKEVYVCVDKSFDGASVKLALDFEDVIIYDKEQDIRLV